MATIFLEPGTAATQNFSLYTNGTNSAGSGSAPTSSTQAVATSPRSAKCTVTSGASDQSSLNLNPGSFNDAGSRFSFFVRFSAVSPASTFSIFFPQTSGFTVCFAIELSTNNVLLIADKNFTTQATGTTVLSANVDYRISIAYTIINSTTNTIKVWINGNLEITATNITVNTGTNVASVGLFTPQTAMSMYIAHLYIDNSAALTDPGDIYVTAKRPFANGTTNGFTASGTPSGYGSGNASYVNLRPLQTATAQVAVTVAGSAITEEYNIEGQSVGDINITGSTIVDFMGWLYAKSSLSETDSIRLVGSNSNISLTSTVGLFTKIAGSTTYPPGTGSDIGMVTNATAATATLYDAGIIVAFIPPPVGAVLSGSTIAQPIIANDVQLA